jgi:5-(carboxyamino)imidazole ribonucleotide mutase
VIGVPCFSDQLGGVDALYSIVQMPARMPVATVGIDGAENAALLAVQILGLGDPPVAEALDAFRAEQATEGMEHREVPAGERQVGFGFQPPSR